MPALAVDVFFLLTALKVWRAVPVTAQDAAITIAFLSGAAALLTSPVAIFLAMKLFGRVPAAERARLVGLFLVALGPFVMFVLLTNDVVRF
jgi:uncharacterized membrane protein